MQKWQRCPLLQQNHQDETTLMKKKLLIIRKNSQIFKIFVSNLMLIQATTDDLEFLLYQLYIVLSYICVCSGCQYLTAYIWLFHSSWHWNFKIGVAKELVSQDAYLWLLVILLCPHVGFLLWQWSGRQENHFCLFLLKQHQFCAIKAPLLVVPLMLIISLKSQFQLFSYLW